MNFLIVPFGIGNVFSSLDGVEFVWELKTVEGIGSVNAESVLRWVMFHRAPGTVLKRLCISCLKSIEPH